MLWMLLRSCRWRLWIGVIGILFGWLVISLLLIVLIVFDIISLSPDCFYLKIDWLFIMFCRLLFIISYFLWNFFSFLRRCFCKTGEVTKAWSHKSGIKDSKVRPRWSNFMCPVIGLSELLLRSSLYDEALDVDLKCELGAFVFHAWFLVLFDPPNSWLLLTLKLLLLLNYGLYVPPENVLWPKSVYWFCFLANLTSFPIFELPDITGLVTRVWKAVLL